MNKNKLCPVCKTHNVIDEIIKKPINIKSYMCLKCGYTTTDEYKTNSKILLSQLETTSQIIIDLQFFDEKTGLHWYPSVFIQKTGMAFPEGTKENWRWVYIPIERVNSEDNIPKQYTTKVVLEKREYFDKLKFFNVLKKFGSFEKDIKLNET